jgi:hypothetical protein
MEKPKIEPVLEDIGKKRHNRKDRDNRMDKIKMPNKFCNPRLAAEDL